MSYYIGKISFEVLNEYKRVFTLFFDFVKLLREMKKEVTHNTSFYVILGI